MKLLFNLTKYSLCIILMLLMMIGVSVWCIIVAQALTIFWACAVVMMSALYAYGIMRLVTFLWPLKYEDWRE